MLLGLDFVNAKTFASMLSETVTVCNYSSYHPVNLVSLHGGPESY